MKERVKDWLEIEDIPEWVEQRLDRLEKAFAEQQLAHDREVNELRERLDGRSHNRSGRSFAMMRNLAEAGARIKERQPR